MGYLLSFLEMIYTVAFPILFWVGILYGVFKSATSSSPHFLGNKHLTIAFGVMILVVVVNTTHAIFKIPFLANSLAIEDTLIFALVYGSLVYAGHKRKAEVKQMVANDPSLQICPKCGAVAGKIYIKCPKCDSNY